MHVYQLWISQKSIIYRVNVIHVWLNGTAIKYLIIILLLKKIKLKRMFNSFRDLPNYNIGNEHSSWSCTYFILDFIACKSL